jgi:hypothetical protein
MSKYCVRKEVLVWNTILWLFLVHRFLSPLWWRHQSTLKHQFLQDPHGVTSQKMAFFRVHLVHGHADYLMKLGMATFGILLTPADHTPHKHLTSCSVLTIWHWRTHMWLWKKCQSNEELGKQVWAEYWNSWGLRKFVPGEIWGCWQMRTKKKLCAVNSWYNIRMVEMTSLLKLWEEMKHGCPISGKRFEDVDPLIMVTKLWPRYAGPEFYSAGIQALVPRWHKAV